MSTHKIIQWGIIGAGNVANDFAQDLNDSASSHLNSVASITLAEAANFAEKHAIHNAYGSSDELLDNPDVDIVYVATPHSAHKRIVLDALNAGKHVLCEKPLALNEADAQVML